MKTIWDQVVEKFRKQLADRIEQVSDLVFEQPFEMLVPNNENCSPSENKKSKSKTKFDLRLEECMAFYEKIYRSLRNIDTQEKFDEFLKLFALLRNFFPEKPSTDLSLENKIGCYKLISYLDNIIDEIFYLDDRFQSLNFSVLSGLLFTIELFLFHIEYAKEFLHTHDDLKEFLDGDLAVILDLLNYRTIHRSYKDKIAKVVRVLDSEKKIIEALRSTFFTDKSDEEKIFSCLEVIEKNSKSRFCRFLRKSFSENLKDVISE